MVSFRPALLYYYHSLLDSNTLSKRDMKQIGDYLQQNLKENTFSQLQTLTDTPLGVVSGTTKLHPIDIGYAVKTLTTDATIQQQAKKSNLTLHEFVFLVNAINIVHKTATREEKTSKKHSKNL